MKTELQYELDFNVSVKGLCRPHDAYCVGLIVKDFDEAIFVFNERLNELKKSADSDEYKIHSFNLKPVNVFVREI